MTYQMTSGAAVFPRKKWAALVVVVALGAAFACNPLDDPLPASVRVVLDGDGSGPFVLITSNQFLGTGPGGAGLTFGAADTALVEVGFDEVFPLGPRNRMYVGLTRPEGSEAGLSVRLRVVLDGETICAREVQASLDSPLECLYVGGVVEGL